MKYKFLIRPALAVIFGFIGAYIARSGTPPEIFAVTGDYFLLVASGAFGVFGFLLPDVITFAWKTGIAELARQLARHLPQTPPFPFRGTRYFGSQQSAKPAPFINPYVVDTSIFIDGRILDISRTGFLYATFLVLPSVIGELQALSDSADELKRARGRRGLDILRTLQRKFGKSGIRVVVLSNEPDGKVDIKLVKEAKRLNACVLTVDYNLNKVASVNGVKVLNINELANALKTVVLPNERLSIQISTKGREKNQGVGYLSDGTMVVVEDGGKLVGKTWEVMVTKVLQTAAGRMIFAKIYSQ